tara:strand:- start:2309 stop:3952 length:1644 start_codon:yes stop_codon:yes gene_type:complete
MDNHLFSNTKILPFWYIKIGIFSKELLTYNNFFNNSDYKIYKLINPDYGFYTLLKPSDIFLIHKDLIFFDNLLIVEFDLKSINIYRAKNNEFNLIKKLTVYYDINNIDFHNFIKNILQDDSRVILSEKMITGIIRYLESGDLNFSFLNKYFSNIDPKKVLRKYKKINNYNYLLQTLNDLVKKYNDPKLKVNKILSSDTQKPNNIKLNDFIEGKIQSNKKEVTYNTLLLSILIGRFGKLTELNKTPMLIEAVLDAYIHSLDYELRQDMNMMIKLFEAEKLIKSDERNRFYVNANYESELYQFFTKHKFWWNIKRRKKGIIDVTNDINKMSFIISNFYKKLQKTIKSINKYVVASKTSKKQKKIIPICCYSGCDNTFIDKNGYLLFVRTLSWIYSSHFYKTATNKFKNIKNFYRDISIDMSDLKIDLIFDQNDEHKIRFNNNEEFILGEIYSYFSIIQNYNNYDDFNINYNLYDVRLSFLNHMKVDLSQYILFALDCKINKYVMWTDDIYMKLIGFLYGNDMIFESIFDGNRILEMYSDSKEFYPIKVL